MRRCNFSILSQPDSLAVFEGILRMSQRRIVMGRRDGRDAIVADAPLDAHPLAEGGVTTHMVWGRDQDAPVPSDGEQPTVSQGFPGASGFRYAVLTIPAGTSDAYHEFIGKALAPFASGDKPGLHWTPTIDCIVVTQGELLLEGDEDRTLVKAGDSVIINGNRHRWSNPGPGDAVLHAISIGTDSHD